MNLEKGQKIELPDGFFGDWRVELLDIRSIEGYDETSPMDVTTESGYFETADGIVSKNCSAHSIEYIKKYGLKGLVNLNSESKPARSASVLTGHLNTYVASMQANYAGALGLAYINTLYAPYVSGMNDDEVYQVAQELVFNSSQNAFSRGGQSLHPSEIIWVKEGGRYRSVEIGPFADALIDANRGSVRVDGEYEIFGTDGLGLEAISFTRDGGRVGDKRIKYVARMPHKGRMYRIHTSNGIVNVTGDHSLFEFRGAGEIVPVKASALKVNSFVVIPHRFPVKDKKTEVGLLDYVREEDVSVYGSAPVLEEIRRRGNPSEVLASTCGATRYIMKDAARTNRVRLCVARHFIDVESAELCLKGDSQAVVKSRIPLSRELGYVAGMYCAEGSANHKSVCISNMDQALLDKVAASLDRMGYPWRHVYLPQRNEDGSQKVCGKVEVSGILGNFIQRSCSEDGVKIVPSWVIDACDECVDGFLEGFYDGDGIHRGDCRWSISSTSRRLIGGIGLLLLRNARECHVYETIHQDNPSWKTLYELRESDDRKVNPFTPIRSEAKFTEKCSEYGFGRKIREDVAWLAASDLSVSRIKKIEEYDYDGYVYDISVPETEAFLGGMGSVFFKNTLFTDFNIDPGVSSVLKDTMAVLPGGKYLCRRDGVDYEIAEREISKDGPSGYPLYEYSVKGEDGKPVCIRREVFKDGVFGYDEGVEAQRAAAGYGIVTYGDFADEAERITMALLKVFMNGDANGQQFFFPKCQFHVSEGMFADEGLMKVFREACRLASVNGSTYFVFDREAVSLSACCFTGDVVALFRRTPDSQDETLPFEELYGRVEDGSLPSRLYVKGEGGWVPATVFRTIPADPTRVRIRTLNGKEVCCTPDHVFPTASGDSWACMLCEGALLFRLSGGETSYEAVDSVAQEVDRGPYGYVYCFRVEDGHEPYFALANGILTHNCRLKTTLTDTSVLKHPERLRFCGFANNTVNIPHCAYIAYDAVKDAWPDHGSEGFRDALYGAFIAEIDKSMDLCLQAHLSKRSHIEKMMEGPGRPLWQVGKTANDGRPYIELDKCTYIIGIIGLNDAVKFMFGKELHEGGDAEEYGLRTIAHMYMRIREYKEKHGLKFSIEETPAESAARRLARADLLTFPEYAKKVVQGRDGYEYYTNSVHLRADAPTGIVERIQKQSMYHPMIESGAIIHVFCGEETPDPKTIEMIVTETFRSTQCAQLCFSPTYTYCDACHARVGGSVDACPQCGSRDVFSVSRVVGYFSKIQDWNKSKQEEGRARTRGNYKFMEGN